MPVMQHPEAYLGHVNDDSFDESGCLKDGPLKDLVVVLAQAFADWVDMIHRSRAALAEDSAHAAAQREKESPGLTVVQVTLARLRKRGWSHSLLLENVAEDFGGADDFAEAVVERREAEAHQIGRAEIADYAARDQRLDHRIAFRDGRN